MKFDACVLECVCIFQFSLQVVNNNAHFTITPTCVSKRFSSETWRIYIGVQKSQNLMKTIRDLMVIQFFVRREVLDVNRGK